MELALAILSISKGLNPTLVFFDFSKPVSTLKEGVLLEPQSGDVFSLGNAAPSCALRSTQ